jgi:hypothetical protein
MGGTVLLLAVLAFAAVWFYQTDSHRFPRVGMGMGLAGFDRSKAELLSAAQRGVYEDELFDELAQWNQLSKRFPAESGVKNFLAAVCARDARWKTMAQDGFELAHLARQAYNPCHNFVFRLEGPLKRLHALAEQGDVGAMCLMGGLRDPRQDLEPWEDRIRTMLERGAAQGHPECLWQLAQRVYPGVDGDPGRVEKALSLAARATEGGAYRAADLIRAHFWQLSKRDLRYAQQEYCWATVYDKSAVAEDMAAMSFQTYIVISRARRIESLEALMMSLKGQSFGANDCAAMGLG